MKRLALPTVLAAFLLVGAVGCGGSDKSGAPAWDFLRPVICQLDPASGSTAPSTKALSETAADGACATAKTGTVPGTAVSADRTSGTGYVVLDSYDGTTRFVLGPAEVSGTDVSRASQIGVAGGTGIELTLSGKGEVALETALAHPGGVPDGEGLPNYESELAVDVDGAVLAVPTIYAPTFTGVVTIQGSAPHPFTSAMAQQYVADILRAR